MSDRMVAHCAQAILSASADLHDEARCAGSVTEALRLYQVTKELWEGLNKVMEFSLDQADALCGVKELV